MTNFLPKTRKMIELFNVIVTEISNEEKVQVNFFPKNSKTSKNDYVFPPFVDDVIKVDIKIIGTC